jgi:hypothetical protein
VVTPQERLRDFFALKDAKISEKSVKFCLFLFLYPQRSALL